METTTPSRTFEGSDNPGPTSDDRPPSIEDIINDLRRMFDARGMSVLDDCHALRALDRAAFPDGLTRPRSAAAVLQLLRRAADELDESNGDAATFARAVLGLEPTTRSSSRTARCDYARPRLEALGLPKDRRTIQKNFAKLITPFAKHLLESDTAFTTHRLAETSEPRAEWMRVDWAEYDQLVRELAARLLPYREASTIVAIARGGLVPAVSLSHYLAIHLFRAVRAWKYMASEGPSDTTQVSVEQGLLGPVDPGVDTIIVVDEIVDSGETIEAVGRLLSNYFGPGVRLIQAALLRRSSAPEPSTLWGRVVWAKTVVDDAWVQLPWDMPEDAPRRFPRG